MTQAGCASLAAMRCVLGVDAGGTKTTAMLADEQGRVLGEVHGDGANLKLHGELQVEKVLHDLVEQLEAHGRIAAVCLGMAGVDRPGEREVVQSLLRRLGLRVPTRIEHDAAIALVAGAPAGVGIVVLSGTGSIAYGQDARGGSARAGGWGPLLADEGSAYWIGEQALRRVTRSLDGRGPESALVELVFAHLGLERAEQLVPRVYEQGLGRVEVAALAPAVQAASDRGDPVARELLEGAAQALARCARAVSRQVELGPEPYPLVLAGGAFAACPSLAGLFERELDLPLARPRVLDREPVHGAVTLARRLLGTA